MNLQRIWPILVCLITTLNVAADEAAPPVGMTERLGEFAALDARLTDEQGTGVVLGDLLGKPTILNLVYYTCPGICTPLLGGLQTVLDQVKLVPGADYRVVTVSINFDEPPGMAAEKKSQYLQRFARPFPPEEWRWLTGDSINIDRLTRSVGFGFQRTGEDFAHPASLVLLTPEGKISRYLPGSNFNPFDLQMAVTEASEGKTGPTIAKLLQFCFSYDPEGREYVFNFKRIFGSVVLLFSALFIVTVIIRARKKHE